MQDAIASIYRAASGQSAWDDALSQATSFLGLRGSQMVGVSPRNGGVLFSHSAHGAPSDADLDYVRQYHRVDPRIPLLLASQPGDWLYDEDAFGDSIATTNPYYRDLLIPYGSRYTASAKLLESEDEVVLIAFLARIDDDGFGPQRRQDLTAMGTHLKEAASIYRHTRRMRVASFAGTQILERMARPAFLLGTDRSLSMTNALAKQALQRRTPVRMTAGRLTAADSDVELQLSTAFDQLLSHARDDGSDKRIVCSLRASQSSPPSAASLTLLVPQQTMFAFGDLPQVLLLLHDLQHREKPDTMLWEAAYGLTPAQSRVALSVYRGLSVKQAAKSLHIAESTLRTHLNDVFAKTETRRQAQLVALLSAL